MESPTASSMNRAERRAMVDELARQAQAGSQNAFIEITRRFERELYIYCYYLIRDREENKDALQDIFIRVYRNIGDYSGESPFSAWLYKIAYNHSMNVLKKKKRHQRIADRYQKEAAISTSSERESAVMELLDPLTPSERNLVLLKAVEQYTFEEIGQIMDCKPATLRKQYERTRNKLVQFKRNKGGQQIEQISDPAKQATDNLEYIIQHTEVPELNLGERIVEQMNNTNTELNQRNRGKNKLMKRVMAASGIAAALGFGVIGSGFVSPVMASALSQVPLIGNIFQEYGDAGLKASVVNGLYQPVQAKDSHNDLTLESTGYIYDGTRISVALKREGIADARLLGERLDNGDTDTSGKGALKDIHLFINGKEYFTGGYTIRDGDTQDTIILEFNDSLPITLLDADVNKARQPEPLGDAFDLKLEATLTGSDQPYVLTFPVKKNTDNLILKPETVKSHDGFNLTLDKLEMTPITTRVTMTGSGEFASLGDEYKLPAEDLYAGKHMIGFDIYDENNHLLEELRGNIMNFIGGQYVFDYNYTPFTETPTSITIKPYVMKQDEGSGEYIHKTYISELEFHVDVK